MTDKAEKEISKKVLREIAIKVLKDKAESKPDTTTATACFDFITTNSDIDNYVTSAKKLIKSHGDNKKIPLFTKDRENKYTPRDGLGHLMDQDAEHMAKIRNGALITNDQMLKVLEEQSKESRTITITVRKSDDEYVIYEDQYITKPLIVKKKAFEKRMTATRNRIKEEYSA